MTLIEIANDTTLDEVQKATGGEYKISPNLKNF